MADCGDHALGRSRQQMATGTPTHVYAKMVRLLFGTEMMRTVPISVGLSLAVFLAVAPALAQTLPPNLDKTLWCANALIISGQGTGSEASELTKRGNSLLANTQLALLEQGFGDEQIKELVDGARAQASRELLASDLTPRFSYEDCLDAESEPQ